MNSLNTPHQRNAVRVIQISIDSFGFVAAQCLINGSASRILKGYLDSHVLIVSQSNINILQTAHASNVAKLASKRISHLLFLG